jgi:hypothetical protein
MEVRRLPPADYFLFSYYVQFCSHAFAWPPQLLTGSRKSETRFVPLNPRFA